MFAFLFILLITALGVFISIHLSPEVTWFTYYIGGIGGLLLSAVSLHFWNKRKGKQKEEDPLRGSPL